MMGALLIFFGGLVLINSGDTDYTSTRQWITGLVLVVLGGVMHMVQKVLNRRDENQTPEASGTEHR